MARLATANHWRTRRGTDPAAKPEKAHPAAGQVPAIPALCAC